MQDQVELGSLGVNLDAWQDHYSFNDWLYSSSQQSWYGTSLIGTVTSLVKGIGGATVFKDDELLALVRYAKSPHEDNDIKVFNSSSMEVGYLYSRVAVILPPLLDAHKIILEGELELYDELDTKFWALWGEECERYDQMEAESKLVLCNGSALCSWDIRSLLLSDNIRVEEPLKDTGSNTLRLDASTDVRSTAEIIKEFGATRPDTVLLASLQSLGVDACLGFSIETLSGDAILSLYVVVCDSILLKFDNLMKLMLYVGDYINQRMTFSWVLLASAKGRPDCLIFSLKTIEIISFVGMPGVAR
ncbi:unnamed protein product [Dovyalis caffra]|uniref:HIRAN domain-containing protein n=1 Tax=Dovyalis caffra TaxID=77055 RepID=A0AAV1RQT5_9ROSI|nr:unnamed protein product [Dovyalis caffra]